MLFSFWLNSIPSSVPPRQLKIFQCICHQFVEGDIFSTVIPLSEAATATVGPVTIITPQDTLQVRLLEFCSEPKIRQEMLDHLGLSDRKHFREAYLNPLLASGKLKMTLPDKPNSRNQKYVRV